MEKLPHDFDTTSQVINLTEKINEIVEWINTQQVKIDLQDQYKQ